MIINSLHKFYNLKNSLKSTTTLTRPLWNTVKVVPLAVALAACSISPTPITNVERNVEAGRDLNIIFSDQEKIVKPVTMYEAMARAIKYNLDHRVKLMEKVVALGQLEVSKYEMLPDLVASAGYHDRSEFSGGSSFGLSGPTAGTTTLNSSTSQEKERNTRDLKFSWNLLDLGLSYYNAKQQADLSLVAEEQRRKAIQNIIQDVRYAYWRAVSADRLIDDIDRLKNRVETALRRSRSVEQERVGSPLDALNFQKNLLETLRQLSELRQNLTFAKTELAALINVKPGQKFELADAPHMVKSFKTPDLDVMEKVALINRPELREEDYRKRISDVEIRKAWVELLPGINLDWTASYDSNKFLEHNDWNLLAIDASLNLFNLLKGPKKAKLAETQGNLAEARRRAMTLAVLTQVNVAKQRYKMAQEDYELSSRIKTVDSKIFNVVKNREVSDIDDEQKVIMASANALLGRLRKDHAYAELQNAVGSVYFSAGLDPIETKVDNYSITGLANAIESRMKRWEMTDLAKAVAEIEEKATAPEGIKRNTSVKPKPVKKSAYPTSQSAMTVKKKVVKTTENPVSAVKEDGVKKDTSSKVPAKTLKKTSSVLLTKDVKKIALKAETTKVTKVVDVATEVKTSKEEVVVKPRRVRPSIYPKSIGNGKLTPVKKEKKTSKTEEKK